MVGMFFVPQTMRAADFTVGHKTFLLDGKPFVIKAAEVHYPRIPRAYWEHRIQLCKSLGMNTLCIYVFWNIHEQREALLRQNAAFFLLYRVKSPLSIQK